MDWLDHNGNIMTGPDDGGPTGYRWDDQRTHRLMAARPGQVLQAITWCGRRALEVPGRGPIDCPACLALLAEDAST